MLNIPEMIDVLGHDSALKGYTGPGSTLKDKFVCLVVAQINQLTSN